MRTQIETLANLARNAALSCVLLLSAAPALAQTIPVKAYEAPARIETKNTTEQKRKEMAEFVAGNMLFVLLHEMAHVHVSEMGLPVLGREEDAADAYATLAMLRMGSEFSYNVLIQAAKGWFLSAERGRRRGDMPAFYDEHGLDEQRAYQIVCLMVGSDPERFKALAEFVKMPEERQESCQGDYSNAVYSWDLVLKSHRRAAGQPKTEIETVYGEGHGALDVNVQSFRSLRLLETIAERASDEFVWRKSFAIEMKSCGASAAHWSLSSHRLTICYELAEEFVQLYRNDPINGKPMAQVAASELSQRNIRGLTLRQAMAPADASDEQNASAQTQASVQPVSLVLIEQFARALDTQPVHFAAPVAKTAATKWPVALQRASR
jgi:hypothetical protein